MQQSMNKNIIEFAKSHIQGEGLKRYCKNIEDDPKLDIHTWVIQRMIPKVNSLSKNSEILRLFDLLNAIVTINLVEDAVLQYTVFQFGLLQAYRTKNIKDDIELIDLNTKANSLIFLALLNLSIKLYSDKKISKDDINNIYGSSRCPINKIEVGLFCHYFDLNIKTSEEFIMIN